VIVNIDERPKRKRVCHTCAISMDQILVDSVRNSAEMSMTYGDGMIQIEDIMEGKKAILARSFEETVKDFSNGVTGMLDMSNPNISMMAGPQKSNLPNTSMGMIDMNPGEGENCGGARNTKIQVEKLFYEPNISKPVRGQKSLSIMVNE
jgi:hypothetical protein